MTCGECRHWHEQEQPKQVAGPILLGQQMPTAPRVGQCRQGPPNVVVIQMPVQTTTLANGQIDGRIEIKFVTQYPSPSADFPACGQFEERWTNEQMWHGPVEQTSGNPSPGG